MVHIVRDLKLSPVFCEAPYLDHCHFNIFLYDIFQFSPDLDIASYADDNTPHSTNINLNMELEKEKESNTLFKWLMENLLKLNPEKSHLFTNSAQQIQINIGGTAITNNKCENLVYSCKMCIHIDNKLIFQSHVRSFCKKDSQKLNDFARIAHSLKFQQRTFFLMLS